MNNSAVCLLAAAYVVLVLMAAPAVAESQCKEEPVEVNHCGVQGPEEAKVQNKTVKKWEKAALEKYGAAWSSWPNAKGRIRCEMVGGKTCCNVAAVPCKVD